MLRIMASFFLFSLYVQITSPAFLAPVVKDLSTQKHIMSVYLNTPPQPTNLLLDLGASAALLKCRTRKTNPVAGRPVTRSLSMPVTDGSNPGPLKRIPHFAFSCGYRSSLKGPTGLAGLGRSNLSIPAQVSAKTRQYRSVFALCLSGSPSAPGVAFFGSTGPYIFLPGKVDFSKHLNYTPLVSVGNNPDRPSEYYITLKSVLVNGKAVRVGQVDHHREHSRGLVAMLSTVAPYTVLRTNIFEAVVRAFAEECSSALNLTAVARPVGPFGLCYKADEVAVGRAGPEVPTVDLVMEGGVSVWRMFGSNSMVRVYGGDAAEDVWCMGFVDGGARSGGGAAEVVIGAHQMEDSLVEFDMEGGRLGFSSSVMVRGTMCANFNFTTNDRLGSLV